MGASRKLQGEIDRVLKKVQEGVDVFDSIWNKVYDTDNANQKEKFEAELKKEIKKLQRYRDQIKTWIQSSEIKDKKVSASYEQALVDARKLIEREMERFKICEKETKTKAFSKEGLGQQPKTDPKEKAKSETRDWLNTVVGELETQIDVFEAEIEGLSVKKGKTKPPRLTHLETSIVRHKAHIIKLELILRLLDNDELSPEQVNDVKEFLDDYVERNQEDFEEFSDVDDLYSTLPLDKVESLEELVTIGPPGLIKATATASQQQVTPAPEQVEEASSNDGSSDVPTKMPPAKINVVVSPSAAAASHAIPVASNIPSHSMAGASTVSAGVTSVRGASEIAGTPSSSTGSLASPIKEEENGSHPARRSSPALADAGLVRGIGKGALSSPTLSNLPLSSSSVSSNGALGAVPSASDIAKRNILGVDDRLGSSGLVQPPVSPFGNRQVLPQSTKANDGSALVDPASAVDNTAIAGRVFSPPVVSNMPWRPGSSFPQNEAVQLRGRTEIAPDQREKFLQRLQQVQQQGHSNLLGMPPLAGGNHKQFSPQQQNPLLPQFNAPTASVAPQGGLGLGLQTPGVNGVVAATIQQPSPIQQSSPQGTGLAKLEEQQQQQNMPDDSIAESAAVTGIGKSTNDDDLKSPRPLDASAGAAASFTEPSQVPRDTDLSPGQPLLSAQPSASLGVIGRKSVSDLGAIGDYLSGSTISTNSGGMQDQLYNLQMLEAAYHRLPQPKDSERLRSYVPRHPAITPPSFPQVQAPIVNNPLFWERLGPDTLFFAFYYQQNTYQQYLAAKELKKQSWRYHKKYNTWFQRHEEPQIATDEYEQGTYVYFDFHVSNDDLKHGWCQRIKTEFRFEYNYLEDELMP
ncbi:general negative regulator of transcription subunit 3 isoform X4 [Syzygium oleosum]|uniref:general negative regulator of transcription subunit 3 isoform X4 n=1 Tax=Syzygium oleosum TaxID=219896 RepID=UPI0024B975D2|nr:general negative regulator of transcription subunit 3 isoform X4 [Syzygium oleosum]